jgi:hypothetical protein
MPTADFSKSDALAWMREGYERVRAEPARWLGMSLVFLAIALGLKRIPFLGNFVLVLITPIMFAGALLAARSPVRAPMPRDAKGWLRALTVDSARELFQVFRREEHAFAIIIVCILTLGLVVLLNIPELLITGGSVVSGLTGASMVGPLRPTMLIGIAVVVALYLLLAMALLYLVPLSLFGRRQPVPAVAESFRSCLDNRKTLALFIAPFFTVNLVTMIGFSVSHVLGLVLLLLLGVISIPAFAIGVNASYRTLFERSATTVTPVASSPAA